MTEEERLALRQLALEVKEAEAEAVRAEEKRHNERLLESLKPKLARAKREFRGEFDLHQTAWDNCLELSNRIEDRVAAGVGRITLRIHSPGGSVHHALSLYHVLRNVAGGGTPVVTVVRGAASSAASFLFLAGDIRLVSPHAVLMHHQPSVGGVRGTATEVESVGKEMIRIRDCIAGIYANRTNLSAGQFVDLTAGADWFTDAAQSLKLGIATALETPVG